MSNTESSNSPMNEPGPSQKRRRVQMDRTAKACLKCRAQKMRCIGSHDPPCVRCRRNGIQCEFVPRANASPALFDLPPGSAHQFSDTWRKEVDSRIQALEKQNEELLGMVKRLTASKGVSPVPVARGVCGSDDQQEDLEGLFQRLEPIRADLPISLASDHAWERSNISTLWQSFHHHMPGLHFLSGQVSFSRPTPILALSVLYMAAAHHSSPSLADCQSVYLQAFERAVNDTAIQSAMAGPDARAQEGYDDVLGIIMVGLLVIGSSKNLGRWVNIAHRLLLDGIEQGIRLEDWRGLWEGLRTIDLEHCSLHLLSPILPSALPSQLFKTSESTSIDSASLAIGQLLQIMQKRLALFVNRGLPSPCDYVQAATMSTWTTSTTEDEEERTAWLAEIEDWYNTHNRFSASASSYVRTIVLLNYQLHKLFVLTLGLAPQRDLPASTAPDILETARLALKIEAAGFDVWSSWDMVMMTIAALVTIQSVKYQVGSSKDLSLARHHLTYMKAAHQSAVSLRRTLIDRLEVALDQFETPAPSVPDFTGPISTHSTLHPFNTYQSNPIPLLVGGPGVEPAPSNAYFGGDMATPADPTGSTISEWPPWLLSIFGQADAWQSLVQEA